MHYVKLLSYKLLIGAKCGLPFLLIHAHKHLYVHLVGNRPKSETYDVSNEGFFAFICGNLNQIVVLCYISEKKVYWGKWIILYLSPNCLLSKNAVLDNDWLSWSFRGKYTEQPQHYPCWQLKWLTVIPSLNCKVLLQNIWSQRSCLAQTICLEVRVYPSIHLHSLSTLLAVSHTN